MQKLQLLTNAFPAVIRGAGCLSQCVRNVIFSHPRFDVDWNRITVNTGGGVRCHEPKREMTISEFGMT